MFSSPDVNIIEKHVIMILTSGVFLLENITIDVETESEIFKQRSESNSPLTIFVTK